MHVCVCVHTRVCACVCEGVCVCEVGKRDRRIETKDNIHLFNIHGVTTTCRYCIGHWGYKGQEWILIYLTKDMEEAIKTTLGRGIFS